MMKKIFLFMAIIFFMSGVVFEVVAMPISSPASKSNGIDKQSTLITYYSKMGTTRKVAHEIHALFP